MTTFNPKIIFKYVVVGVGIFLLFSVLQLNPDKVKILLGNGERKDLSPQFAFTNLENSTTKLGKALWNSIQPAFKCPELSRVGKSGDGGKYVCGLTHLGSFFEQNPDIPCIVYSFGVLGDSSFEAQVLTNTRCSLYAYDPSVSSIAQPLTPKNPRVHFFKMGVGGNNTVDRKTLKTMMEENGGHQWIDIVKMDVEGSEYATLDRVLEDFDQLPIGQLLVEFHVDKIEKAETQRILQLITNLESRGLRMFSKEINSYNPEHCSEFSFINTNSLERFIDV